MKPRTVVLALALLAACTISSAASAQVGSKRADIMRLLEITGAAKSATQMVDMMLPSLKQSMPQVPEAVWQEFRSEIREDELVDLTYAIWDKHFTHAEIRDLIRFYQTPTGQKIIRETPAIQQESLVAGQKWGNAIVTRMLERLREKGYPLPPSLQQE